MIDSGSSSILIEGAFGFFIGACLGSFSSALVWRVPRGIPWAFARADMAPVRSICPSCKTILRARDLVPLFSWMFNRGRCAHCNSKIPIRYPLLELGFAGAGAMFFSLMGLTFPAFILAISLTFLIIFLFVGMSQRFWSGHIVLISGLFFSFYLYLILMPSVSLYDIASSWYYAL